MTPPPPDPALETVALCAVELFVRRVRERVITYRQSFAYAVEEELQEWRRDVPAPSREEDT